MEKRLMEINGLNGSSKHYHILHIENVNVMLLLFLTEILTGRLQIYILLSPFHGIGQNALNV